LLVILENTFTMHMKTQRTDKKTDRTDGKTVLCQRTFSSVFRVAILHS